MVDVFGDSMLSNTSDEGLKDIGVLSQRLLDLRAEAAAMEEQLKQLREQQRVLEEKDIPDAMDAVGIEEFKLTSGEKVKITDVVRANIPKAREDAAFSWLRENGHGDLIKTAVSMSFGRGEEDLASRVVEAIKKASNQEPDQKRQVPWNTLTAFCKEQLKLGAALPAEDFGLYQGRKAIVK